MRTPLPTLDVVIPCYNEEQDIAQCLDLLLEQRADLRRVIVVDNNSNDTTVQILREYQTRYPNVIQLLNESRQGAQYARNTGFDAVQADVIARIDADTRVTHEWAHNLRQQYAARPDMQAATGATEFYDLPLRRICNFITWLFMYSVNDLIGGSVGLYGANMSIRRPLWQKVKHDVNMDQDIMEDLSIALAIHAIGSGAVYLPQAFARVSGRRIRTSPRQFRRYNAKWWRTYQAYDRRVQAVFVRVMVWCGDALQTPAAYILQYHDHRTGRFHLRKVARYEERIIP